jgi:NAD(P)-dependent dehydrogenase (short-subunit alcohol dehydrogenase family)
MKIVGGNLGRCDHVVNNAGFNIRQRIPDVDLQSWDLVFSVNLRAPMFLVQGAMSIWRDRPGKSITNIGSRAWISGASPAYTASKTGLIGLTRSMAVELGPLGIRANAVIPSYVESGFTRAATSDTQIREQQETALAVSKLGRLCVPEDIAGAVSFLSSEDGAFITGETLHVCGGAQMAQSNARRAI